METIREFIQRTDREASALATGASISTATGKQEFIRQLCAAVLRDALEATTRMPEEWDGRELREYLADKFERSRMPVDDRKRRKAYRNFVLVNDL